MPYVTENARGRRTEHAANRLQAFALLPALPQLSALNCGNAAISSHPLASLHDLDPRYVLRRSVELTPEPGNSIRRQRPDQASAQTTGRALQIANLGSRQRTRRPSALHRHRRLLAIHKALGSADRTKTPTRLLRQYFPRGTDLAPPRKRAFRSSPMTDALTARGYPIDVEIKSRCRSDA